MRTTFIGEAYHPCVRPLDELKSITLAELRLAFCHPELAELVAYMANAKEFVGGPSAKVLMDFARETWLLVHGDTEGFEQRYGSGS